MNKHWKIAAIVTVAVALIVGGGSLVMAQTSTTPPAVVCDGAGLRGLGGNVEVLTGLLGLTEDQIHALRAEGKSLTAIAATKGISENALVAALLKAHTEAVQAAVTAGRLTQAQADLAINNMEVRIRQMVTVEGVGPFGMGPGFGGCRGAIDSDDVAAGSGFGGLRGFRGGCR